MTRYRIETAPTNCSGCLRCELACSDIHSKQFNLSEARIKVVVSGADCIISFSDECSQCGICTDHCWYGALSKIKISEDDK